MRIECPAIGTVLIVMAVWLMVPLGGCGSTTHRFEWVTLAEGLRVDVVQRVVEFDGEVGEDVHHPDTPIVWLELFVTGPDSREYESLVVTRVPASLIHAGLLAAGFEPGSVGRIWMNDEGEIERERATGEALRVEFVLGEFGGRERSHDPAAWAERVETGEVLRDSEAWDGFVFAGSREITRQGRTMYDADGTGVIVGLSTFGSAVISPSITVSHESEVDPAVWIARRAVVPGKGTRVRVRVWGESRE